MDVQEIRAWLHVPGQPWGSCCGRSLWGIQYPRLRSIFLCPGSAAKDRALFPSLSPFPLLAPNAASPRCQVSTLLPRTFTQQWHQTPGLSGIKAPTNVVTNHSSGEKDQRSQSCLQCHGLGDGGQALSPTPCRGCRVNS